MERIRKHIIVTGEVQGVGFRYRVSRAAAHYGVTGWVRNLPDGSVEMELEGIREDLDAVLTSAGSSMWVEIGGIESRTIPLQNSTGFEIRY